MSNKKFFKQHLRSGKHEWTTYGYYEDNDVTAWGAVRCIVDDVDNDSVCQHLQHTSYRTCFDPDDLTIITEEEYQSVINKLREAESYLDKADEVLKQLI